MPLIVSAPITSVDVMSMSSTVVPVGRDDDRRAQLGELVGGGGCSATVLSFA